MIVRNESRIIERCLASVHGFIDCACICDTGSTDDTLERIKTFFITRDLPVKLFSEPFRDFAYNRNLVLAASKGLADTYLLLDADMVLHWDGWDPTLLDQDALFMVYQGTEALQYSNIRIIPDVHVRYKGVTHEYLDQGEVGFPVITLSRETIWIEDIGDGGCKKQKFQRDIDLLTRGLLDEPENERYVFYLANSYFDLGQWTEARKWYTKRAGMGGWVQEIWVSHHKMALCSLQENHEDRAVFHWLKAYEVDPQRLESLYYLVEHFRKSGKTKTALLFLRHCRPLPTSQEKETFLFYNNEVYLYKMAFEETILHFYQGIKRIGPSTLSVFQYCPDIHMIECLIANMRFYEWQVPGSHVVDFTGSRSFGSLSLYSSSPCLFPCPEGDGNYWMNVRFVNYKIDPSGRYHDCDDHIVTQNVMLSLDKDLHETSEEPLPFRWDPSKTYQGIEDLRWFVDNTNNSLRFLGTAQHQDGTLGVVTGIYPHLDQAVELRPSFCNAPVEKNWVFVQSGTGSPLQVVYKWHPFTLCQIQGSSLVKVREVATPVSFQCFRGSTCGHVFEEEVWFVVHIVAYGEPRHYYHLFVVFDVGLTQCKRFSQPFSFEAAPIEYCLGLVIDNGTFLLSYSTWDRTTKIKILDRIEIEALFTNHS